MKLAIISAVALLMLASVPAEARTVAHHASASHASAHVSKVSDSTKSHKKAKHHKAKKAKHTS